MIIAVFVDKLLAVLDGAVEVLFCFFVIADAAREFSDQV